MRKRVVAAVLLGLAVTGCSVTGTLSSQNQRVKTTTPSTSTPVPATPKPAGTASGSCNYTLSSTLSGPNYLIGEVDLSNTGNVGSVVRVRIGWPQEGSVDITKIKTVHLPYGAHNWPVHFKVLADDSVITNLQDWEEGHGLPQNDCSYHTAIINTFGQTH